MKGHFKGLLTIIALIPHVFAQDITKIAYNGTTTIIECPIQQVFTLPDWLGPPGDVAYYDPGTGIFNHNDLGEKASRLSIAADNKSMVMRDTRLSDAGLYRCLTIVGNTLYQGRINIEVRVKANRPEITASVSKEGRNVLATEGDAFTVYCTSRGGNPAPTVVLYRGSMNDPVLPETTTVSPEEDTYTVRLSYKFAPTRQDDRQQLVCRSYWKTPETEQDSKQSNATLFLYLTPTSPDITQTSSVITGGDVLLVCKTSGSRPAANISWTYRGQKTTPAVNVTEDQATQTFTVVSVFKKRVTAADNGQTVLCSVINKAVRSALNTSRALNVQFPVSLSTTRITGNRVTIANGSNPLTLTCTTGSSNPTSVITWRNGTDVISNNNAYTDRTGANNGVVRSQELTLRPKRYDQGNTISCSVSNGVLDVTDSISEVLDLHYSPLIADISDWNVTEGNSITLKCNASSKPSATFTWKKGSDKIDQGVGTSGYNGFDYKIDSVYRNQSGSYSCTADNSISPKASKEAHLTVLYPPDVEVKAVNSSVLHLSTTVTCEASGLPNQYKYGRWIHTWNGQVVSHPEQLSNTRVLTLTNLSYAHSGVYTCQASNGIKNVSRGSGSLLIRSYPIIIGTAKEQKELKASGQLMQRINITFQFYSNAERTSVSVYKADDTRKKVGDINLSDKQVMLPVFQTDINTTATEALISINVTEDIQFGEYVISVENEIGAVNLSLLVKPLGPPEPPFDVNLTFLDYQSVDVMWKSGFPNGLNQTFIIQLSTDNSKWRNISHYGGLSFPAMHTKRLNNLAASQLYFVRIVAKNEIGESEPTSAINFETSAAPPDSSSSPHIGAIAGAIGGSVAALVIVIIVIFVIWRRKGMPSFDKPKDNGNLVGTSNENPGFDDSDEVVNTLYVSAGPHQTETVFTSSARKPTAKPPLSADIYAKVNKRSEVVYAVANKPKEKKSEDPAAESSGTNEKGKKMEKTRKQKSEKIYNDAKKMRGKNDKAGMATGDVYENAPSNKYANASAAPSGENVYEDTNIDVSQTPKKSPRTDGLVYADLEFKSPSKGKDQNKIIGIEDRCEYTTIDLTKKAKPLPDNDDGERSK